MGGGKLTMSASEKEREGEGGSDISGVWVVGV